jgi:Rrf2 family protein
MLSKRAKYAIRSLVYLGQKQGQGPVAIQEISETLTISRKFLEAILLDLRNEGILQSRKGQGGGYSLERSPDTVSVARVIRLVDGPLAAVPCVSQTAYARCDDCPDEKACLIRGIMKEVRDSTAHILENTMLDQLIRKAQEQEIPPGAEYQI